MPAEWRGQFGKNGEEMTLFGTIEEVVKEVASINPDYVWADQDEDMVHIAGLEEDDAWLERKVSKLDCSAVGTRALRNPIKMGIHYLYTKPKDTCRLEARSCTRVSCSWDSAIYVCFDPNKDSPKVYELPWWYVADYAKGLFLKWCAKESPPKQITGRVWDPLGLVVFIRGDRC